MSKQTVSHRLLCRIFKRASPLTWHDHSPDHVKASTISYEWPLISSYHHWIFSRANTRYLSTPRRILSHTAFPLVHSYCHSLAKDQGDAASWFRTWDNSENLANYRTFISPQVWMGHYYPSWWVNLISMGAFDIPYGGGRGRTTLGWLSSRWEVKFIGNFIMSVDVSKLFTQTVNVGSTRFFSLPCRASRV